MTEKTGLPPLEQMKSVSEKLKELHDEFLTFAQAKSDFQIEKFSILAEGATRSHQYRHALKQIEVGLYQVKLWLLDAEKYRRKIERLKRRKRTDDDLKIYAAETELDRLELSITGRLREINTYDRMASYIKKTFGPFTAEQYQADEAAYYKERLAKQLCGSLAPEGQGNWLSVDNATCSPLMPGSNNQITLPKNSKDLILLAKGNATS